MTNNLQSIIENLEKGDKLVLDNHENFSNEILIDESLQCSILGGNKFHKFYFQKYRLYR